MQFNREALNSLLAQEDTALWSSICSIAAASGVKLPLGAPPAVDMARLRAALSSTSQSDIGSALKIIDDYRNSRR